MKTSKESTQKSYLLLNYSKCIYLVFSFMLGHAPGSVQCCLQKPLHSHSLQGCHSHGAQRQGWLWVTQQCNQGFNVRKVPLMVSKILVEGRGSRQRWYTADTDRRHLHLLCNTIGNQDLWRVGNTALCTSILGDLSCTLGVWVRILHPTHWQTGTIPADVLRTTECRESFLIWMGTDQQETEEGWKQSISYNFKGHLLWSKYSKNSMPSRELWVNQGLNIHVFVHYCKTLVWASKGLALLLKPPFCTHIYCKCNTSKIIHGQHSKTDMAYIVTWKTAK